MKKKLDARKEYILKSIIDEYVDTAEPVSSNSIMCKYPTKVSSATIRNEMLELENLGFLEKQHTSSGRVPSKLGYKYYVKELIKDEKLDIREVKKIKKKLEVQALTLEEITKLTISTISEITHYTSIAISPNMLEDIINSVQFIRINNDVIMVLLITKKGMVKETIIKFDDILTDEMLTDLQKLFNNKLIGKPLSNIGNSITDYITDEVKIGIDILKKIIEELNKLIIEDTVYIEGATKSFELPELSNTDFKDEYLEIIQDKSKVEKILKNSKKSNLDSDVEDEMIEVIMAGDEDGLENFSIVKLSPKVEDNDLGKIAVLAPKRMDYKKVILTMEELFKEMNKKAKRRKAEKEKKKHKNEK